AAIEQARSNAGAGQGSRVSMIVCLPQSISLQLSRDHRDLFVEYMKQNGLGDDFISIDGTGFIGVDAKIDLSDEEMMKQIQKFIRERLQTSEFHPDGWDPVLIRDPHDTKVKLTAVAGDKYSYRELDDFTDLIEKTLKTLPIVSKVARSGILNEKIYFYYFQKRLASFRIQKSTLPPPFLSPNPP